MAKSKKVPGKKKLAAKVIIKRATTKRRTAVVARKPKSRLWAGEPIINAINPSDEPLPLRLVGMDIPHEEIARRAYELWEQRLRIANDSAKNWQDAERELRRW